jgi:putative FmdB family regulatory protein
MLTYEYQCDACGLRFEKRQAITEEPMDKCPQCHGEIRQVISGGSGFMIKGASRERRSGNAAGCSFESTGRTCCGQEQRCGKPPCGAES